VATPLCLAWIHASSRLASCAKLEATALWGLKREVDAKNGDGRHSAEGSPFPFAHFGMLTGGECWLSADGRPDAIPLWNGDCFLSAPGSPYTLGDNPRTGAQNEAALFGQCGGGLNAAVPLLPKCRIIEPAAKFQEP
jgi:hypothetical protein